jgi:hypothetical protein
MPFCHLGMDVIVPVRHDAMAPLQATLEANRPHRTRTAVVCHLLSYLGEHCMQPQYANCVQN